MGEWEGEGKRIHATAKKVRAKTRRRKGPALGKGKSDRQCKSNLAAEREAGIVRVDNARRREQQ